MSRGVGRGYAEGDRPTARWGPAVRLRFLSPAVELVKISRPNRFGLTRPTLIRPTLLLLAGGIGLAGAGERFVVGRPEPAAATSRAATVTTTAPPTVSPAVPMARPAL